VQNEVKVCRDVAFVTLPDRCSDCGDSVVVVVDKSDLKTMDAATDGLWQHDAPGHFPPGVYLPQHGNKVVGLARLLLNAPPHTWRMFRDGDPLNCRRANLALQSHWPRQQDWLWSPVLPQGFTEVRRSENYIMVRAEAGADHRLMWQYLLERWQFVRSRNIVLTIPHIHAVQTSWLHRISVIINEGNRCTSFDIGDDGARENYADSGREKIIRCMDPAKKERQRARHAERQRERRALARAA
jgi:hypothetical protein